MPSKRQEVLPTSGLGFRFIRYFILAILGTAGILVGVVVLLGWRLGMDITINGTGQIQPIAREIVKAQRAGLVKQVHVKHGQNIKQGDVLISLNDIDLHNELEQINNEMRLNEIRRQALPAEIERERAIIEMDIARATADRDTELIHLEQVRKEFEFYHEVLPYQEHKNYDDPIDQLIPIRVHKTKLRRAEAEIGHSKKRLAALVGRTQELKELRQLYRKLQSQRRLLQIQIEQMRIYAPVSGTILTQDLDKRIGDWLNAGEPILELAELSGWQAQVQIPEVDIPKIKIGQPVRLYVDAFPHMQYKIFEGTVTDILQKPEPATTGISNHAFYSVKVLIADPVIFDGEKQYSLAYGMGVEAKIVIERGPIVELLWKKFLKTIGRIDSPEVYRLYEADN